MTRRDAGKEEREARLAAQLRTNLARRKQARASVVDDQRPSASDPSDVAAPAA